MNGVEVEERQLVQLLILPIQVAHGLLQSTHDPFTTNLVLSAQLEQKEALEQVEHGNTHKSQVRVEAF